MTSIRRALVLASLERYVVIISTFALTIIISRLLGPEEFGVSVLGNSVWAIAEAVRDAGINTYLVQQKSLTPEKIRTAFTITLLLTAVAVVALLLVAPHLAAFYGVAGLEQYMRVLTLCYALGPFVTPIFAQLRREMAFGPIALMAVVVSLLNMATAVGLAMLGFSYMSLAWGSLVSATTGMLLMFIARPDFTIFRPSLREWRSVLSYGVYDSAATILYRLWTTLPYLIFGRLLSAEAVGLYQRATTLCSMPEKVLAGVGFVSLPAFAAAARDGRDLKSGYLKGLQYVTAVQWPALLLIALLAHPIVRALLGSRWGDSAPLVQIMACASLFWFPSAFTGPVLIAAGAVRHTLTQMAISLPFSLIVITAAASHGLYTVALSTFLTIPFHVVVGLRLIRRHLQFRWSELAAAVQGSAVVALLSALGPLAVVLAAGGSGNVSILMAAAALALAAIGWAAGLWLSNHPVLYELLQARDALLKSRIGAKLIGRLRALG
jgi:O-antigen/teichoic acid export membrane protein